MIKTVVFAILIIVLAAFIVWLWQRQPKAQIASKTEHAATIEAKNQQAQKLLISPTDGQIFTQPSIKFSGQSSPNTYLAIYTNDNQYILKTNGSGKFEKELTWNKGLNLLNITGFTPDLNSGKTESMAIFVGQTDKGDNVRAGSVKTILDTIVTISTANGDKNIRTTRATELAGTAKEATSSVQNSVRVGDFVIAIGSAKDADSQDTQSLEIIRENKPQNKESVLVGKIVSGVNQNIFSTKDAKDGKLLEFTLNKNSDISNADKSGTSKDIAKDKTAFIAYYADSNKNVVDLVYLLP